jgi:hypothetical protein
MTSLPERRVLSWHRTARTFASISAFASTQDLQVCTLSKVFQASWRIFVLQLPKIGNQHTILLTSDGPPHRKFQISQEANH